MWSSSKSLHRIALLLLGGAISLFVMGCMASRFVELRSGREQVPSMYTDHWGEEKNHGLYSTSL